MERTCPKCGSQIVGQKKFLLRPRQKSKNKKKKSDFEEAVVWFLGLSPKHEIVRKRTQPQAADSANWTDIICVLCFLLYLIKLVTQEIGSVDKLSVHQVILQECHQNIHTHTLITHQSCQTSSRNPFLLDNRMQSPQGAHKSSQKKAKKMTKRYIELEVWIHGVIPTG